MQILEKSYIPNKQEQLLIDTVLDKDFIWLNSPATNGNFEFKVHNLIARHKDNIAKKGNTVSGYAEHYANMFLSFCKKNDIEVESIYRASLNKTEHCSEKMTPIHCDHEFDHKNFIMYLNNFTNAPTYIFNEKDELITKSNPKKNKCLVFGGLKHSHGFCLPKEERIVFVVTFN